MKTKLLFFFLGLISLTTLQSNAQCTSGTFYGNLGWFDDGNLSGDYTNNENCSWLIESAMGGHPIVGFYNFDTESGYDFVDIYDGVDANAPLIGHFSGNTNPGQISATGNYMYVVWTSDFSNVAPGWDAVFWSYDATFTNCALTVSDGYYDYLDNQTLSWLIQPYGADAITFDLNTMDTEDGYDFVRVYDGVDANAPLLGSYSGTQTGIVTSTGGSLYVEFTSDVSNVASGFSANYTCSTCSGQTTLTAPSGWVGDGSDQGNYGNNANCTWLIQPTNATSIQIDFAGLDIETCCDFLRIYDGANNSAPLLGNVTLANQSMTTTGGVAFVEFTSDYSINGLGWEFNYNSALTGVEETALLAHMSISPNPNNGSFRLDLSGSKFSNGAQMDVLDYTGRIVYSEMVTKTISNISLGTLASGLYLVRVNIGGAIATKQIVLN